MYSLYQLGRDRPEYFTNLAFWREALVYMQETPGNTDSECITTFDEFIGLYNDVVADTDSYDQYQADLEAKGQGSGTPQGFAIEIAQRYTDVMIYSVNVFNYCSLNYYLIAISQAVGSRSGQVAFGINLMWRFFSTSDMTNYYNLSVAVIQDDNVAAGKAVGTFLSLLLAVEVPEQTEAPAYQPVGNLMN